MVWTIEDQILVTRKFHTVNVVYNGIDYRGPDTGQIVHVSTAQSCSMVYKEPVYKYHLYG